MRIIPSANVWVGLFVNSGAGVFANEDFEAEELVLREPPLVGAQHSRNKVS